MRKPILCVDFDGVIHSYSSGWKGIDMIPDPPVPGALEWLVNAIADFDVQIFSSRSAERKGQLAMKQWLYKWLVEKGCSQEILSLVMKALKFPSTKPPAFVSIDDRAILFTGTFPTSEELLAFKPWYQKNSPTNGDSENPNG